jgi:hypothetical protein
MKSESPVARHKYVAEHTWDPSRQALDRDLFQAFVEEEEKNRIVVARNATNDNSGLGLFQNETGGWNTRL